MQLENTIDTTNLSCWLNWRVLLCAVSVLLLLLIELLILWKHEGSRHLTPGKGENLQDRNLSDEAWKPWMQSAVMLTGSIYWCVIFPFLTIKDYDLSFMTVNMHTTNVVLLLGDTALNCLQLPWFRISFFVLWTGAFVIFQWILHAFESIWWPYPFLDLSSRYAPLWYFVMALMHIPCYGLFFLIVDMKHYFLSKWFPSSHQC